MIELQKKYWILDDMIEWEDEGYGIKDLQITLPNICFKDKITLHAERSVDIIQADGHTLGSSYIWEKETRTLIAGDLIFNRQFPFGGDETSDLLKWNGVIDDLINLKPELVISGHGPLQLRMILWKSKISYLLL
jgi:glyoxylase-like metal-dependent hydrolase (beta-lactamase superfamily II)